MKASQYPDVYREAFERASEDEVELNFSTKAKAVAFRVELYKYRYAVRDELPRSREHYDAIMQISMSIQGTKLLLRKKKHRFVEKLNES